MYLYSAYVSVSCFRLAYFGISFVLCFEGVVIVVVDRTNTETDGKEKTNEKFKRVIKMRLVNGELQITLI